MPKTLRCADVTGACDAVVHGETEDEILAQVGPHARDVHGLDPCPPEVVDKARAAIRDE